MITSSSPAVVRYYLALRLVQLRIDTGLTKQQAAQKIGRTGQTVANLEKGFNAPTQSDLEKLLEVYGAAEQFPELRDLLPVARKRAPKRSAPIPEDYDLRLNLEVDMAGLDVLGASLVPGLLQTPDYAAAVFRANPNCSDGEIQQLVDARMERKSIFTRSERPVELHVVLDESVLYRSRGGNGVMRAQLDYLLEVARTPPVDLQVLPLDAGDEATFILGKRKYVEEDLFGNWDPHSELQVTANTRTGFGAMRWNYRFISYSADPPWDPQVIGDSGYPRWYHPRYAVPLTQVEWAVREFYRTEGQRPTCVEWAEDGGDHDRLYLDALQYRAMFRTAA